MILGAGHPRGIGSGLDIQASHTKKFEKRIERVRRTKKDPLIKRTSQISRRENEFSRRETRENKVLQFPSSKAFCS